MTTGVRCEHCVSAEAANERLRAYVRARRGRCCWTPEERAELNRLQAVWLEAARREIDVAA